MYADILSVGHPPISKVATHSMEYGTHMHSPLFPIHHASEQSPVHCHEPVPPASVFTILVLMSSMFASLWIMVTSSGQALRRDDDVSSDTSTSEDEEDDVGCTNDEPPMDATPASVCTTTEASAEEPFCVPEWIRDFNAVFDRQQNTQETYERWISNGSAFFETSRVLHFVESLRMIDKAYVYSICKAFEDIANDWTKREVLNETLTQRDADTFEDTIISILNYYMQQTRNANGAMRNTTAEMLNAFAPLSAKTLFRGIPDRILAFTHPTTFDGATLFQYIASILDVIPDTLFIRENGINPFSSVSTVAAAFNEAPQLSFPDFLQCAAQNPERSFVYVGKYSEDVDAQLRDARYTICNVHTIMLLSNHHEFEFDYTHTDTIITRNVDSSFKFDVIADATDGNIERVPALLNAISHDGPDSPAFVIRDRKLYVVERGTFAETEFVNHLNTRNHESAYVCSGCCAFTDPNFGASVHPFGDAIREEWPTVSPAFKAAEIESADMRKEWPTMSPTFGATENEDADRRRVHGLLSDLCEVEPEGDEFDEECDDDGQDESHCLTDSDEERPLKCARHVLRNSSVAAHLSSHLL